MRRPEPSPEPLTGTARKRIYQGPAQWSLWPRLHASLSESLNSICAQGLGLAEFVLEEWFVNLCTHGQIKAHRVIQARVHVRVDPTGWELLLVDDGLPFNPLTLKAPDTRAPLAERSKGGLGIHLTLQMTQGARYKRWHGFNALWLSWRPN